MAGERLGNARRTNPLALALDANADERRLISAIAARAAWSVVSAADGELAVALLQGPHGREVQRRDSRKLGCGAGPEADGGRSREHRPDLPVIVISHGDTVSIAVEAMRAGASDFLVRPVAPERLLEALAANADRRRASGELAPVSEKLAPALELEQLVGAAPEFRAALAVAAKSARNRLPLLIVGEPGTGKETVARAIHAASLRAKGPLLALDCKSIAANIIDSELFGHDKGAFPGAFAAKTGKLVEGRWRHPDPRRDRGASGRNAGAARPHARHRRGAPVGLNGSYSVDVRVIATSSRPLPDDFHAGLAERIAATTVHAYRPFVDRSSDIPALARHLLTRVAEQAALKPLSIGNDALAVLMRYGWPGNVRQMAGVLFRAALQCDGNSLTADHFPHIADPVALHRTPYRRHAAAQQGAQRPSHRRRAGSNALHRATDTFVRSRRSRQTSFAWRSAIIAGA